jgi:hypothetical protein
MALKNLGPIARVPRRSAAAETMALANDQKPSDGEYFNEERFGAPSATRKRP